MMRKIPMAFCGAAWAVSPLLADGPAEKRSAAGKTPAAPVVANNAGTNVVA